MSDPIIKINPGKPCELEFEVSVQGSDQSDPPIVRLVLEGHPDYACVFLCDKQDGSKWQARLPELSHFTRTSVPFHVEVIVDGYYFEPAEGTIQLITDPKVMFPSASTAGKPTVTTSFTVKQESDSTPAKAEEDEEVTARYGGEMSPTNQLLKPEEPPLETTVKVAQAGVDDEYIDHSRLNSIASEVVPGDSTDPEPDTTEPRVHNDDDEGDEEDFNPKSVAESIVRNTLGKVERPSTRGSLFKRSSDGRPIIEGLETPHTKALKEQRAKAVKQILNQV